MANEPITREEILLNAVATGETANLEPITREEMFLAKLGGADVKTPTPITRKEQFLQKAIENGGNAGGTCTHTVRFFNESVLLQTVAVPHGGSAIYTGDEPVREGDWAFNGWNPAPTNVKADMDCYAQFKSTKTYTRGVVNRTTTDVSSESATKVGQYALNSCASLKSVYLPNVTSIDAFALQNCKLLESVDFPKVTSLGAYAFHGCFALKALILRSNTVCTLASTATFEQSTIRQKTGHIYVPSALLSDYQNATNWATDASQIRAIEDYPEICGGDI